MSGKESMKLSIEIDGQIEEQLALKLVAMVIQKGQISMARKVKKYCHLTTFDSSIGLLEVYVRDRKTEDSLHSFVVRRRSHH